MTISKYPHIRSLKKERRAPYMFVSYT
jgi:hypothetical protein